MVKFTFTKYCFIIKYIHKSYTRWQELTYQILVFFQSRCDPMHRSLVTIYSSAILRYFYIRGINISNNLMVAQCKIFSRKNFVPLIFSSVSCEVDIGWWIFYWQCLEFAYASLSICLSGFLVGTTRETDPVGVPHLSITSHKVFDFKFLMC